MQSLFNSKEFVILGYAFFYFLAQFIVELWVSKRVKFSLPYVHNLNGRNVPFYWGFRKVPVAFFVYSGEFIWYLLSFGSHKVVLRKAETTDILQTVPSFHLVSFWVGLAFWLSALAGLMAWAA